MLHYRCIGSDEGLTLPYLWGGSNDPVTGAENVKIAAQCTALYSWLLKPL